MNATERFLRYAAIPTRSDPDSTATPSTDCQFSLARLLADELTALGLTNARVTDNCFVYAALPATKLIRYTNTEAAPGIPDAADR